MSYDEGGREGRVEEGREGKKDELTKQAHLT